MKYLLIIIMCMSSIIAHTQTKDSVYNYLVKIGAKHPETVLKQAILETGHFKSYTCRVRKNLFGLTLNHKLVVFNNWKESCDKYLKWVQYKYKGGDYHDFLYELGYATDPDYIKKLNSIKI